MTITGHTRTAVAYPATGAPIPLRMLDERDTFDEGWAPYIQTSITIATPALADYVRLDPRSGIVRVEIDAAQTVGAGSSMTLDLVVRQRTKGKKAGTTVLRVTTDESLLQDYTRIGTPDLDVGNLVGSSLAALSRYVLSQIGATIAPPLTPAVLFAKNLVTNPAAEYGEVTELARNYYKNPVFTDELRYAAPGNNTTLAAAAAVVRSGTHSLRAEATAAASIAVSFRDAGQATVDVDSATLPQYQTNFSCSVWVYVVGTARTMTMEIQKMREDGTDYDVPSYGVPVSVGAGWTQVSAEIALTQGEPWVQGFRVIVRSNTATAAQRFYFDDMTILVGSGKAITDEFSGATAASDGQTYAWDLAGSSDPLLGRYYGESVRSAVVPYGYTPGTLNLIANPLDSPLSLYASPTTPRSGTQSVRLRFRKSATGNTLSYDLLLADIGEAIKPGASYAASSWLRTSRANRLILAVRWFNAAGATISTSSAAAVNVVAATWTRLQLPNLVAPAGAVDAKVVVLRDSNANGATGYALGDTIDFDGMMLSEQSNVETYFDGDTAAGGGYTYGWRGEHGKSLSFRNLNSTPIVRPDSAVWRPGQTAWDFIEPLLQQGNYRLFCDEARVWHLVPRTTYTVPGTITATTGDNILDATDDASRDDDWSDAVVVEYRWTDAEGLARVEYDVASNPGYTRGELVTYTDVPYPGPGAAAGILARNLAKARRQTVELVSNYDARPGMAGDVSFDGESLDGVISAVMHAWPEARMTLSIRTEG